MSRARLESLDIEQYDILDYVQFTDNVRYDDKNYINLSLSGPNTFLFSKFQEKTQDDLTITWCVLKIDPKYIYDENTLFSVTNAASNAAQRQYGITGDIEKFKMLFLPELKIKTYNGERISRRNGIKDKYPTDIQAEILVKDSIPIDSILSVCFKNEQELAMTKAALSGFDTSKFMVEPSIFKPNRK